MILSLNLPLIAVHNIYSLNVSDFAGIDSGGYIEFNKWSSIVSDLKSLTYSLYPAEEASKEWRKLHSRIRSATGINILNLEILKNNGFNTEEHFGIVFNSVSPEKNDTQYLFTLYIPVTDQEQSFIFLKEILLSMDYQHSKNIEPQILETENSDYFIYKGRRTLYCKKFADYLIITNAENQLTMEPPVSGQLFRDHENSILMEHYSPKNIPDKNSSYLFKSYLNPRVVKYYLKKFSLPIPMKKALYKEAVDNSLLCYYSISLSNQSIHSTLYYLFDKDYLGNDENLFPPMLKTSNEFSLLDERSGNPVFYTKMRMDIKFILNMVKEQYPESYKSLQDIFKSLFSNNEKDIRNNFLHIFDNDLSIFIESVPNLPDLYKLYLWNIAISFKYDMENKEYLTYQMNRLLELSRKNPNITVTYSSSANSELWQIKTFRSSTPPEAKEEKSVDLAEINLYVLLVNNEAIISLGENPENFKPSIFSGNVAERTAGIKIDDRMISFTYLNMKKLIPQLLSDEKLKGFNNYFNYLDKINNSILYIYKDDPFIGEDIHIELRSN